MSINYDWLPKPLFDLGIDLSDSGIAGLAWPYPAIIDVLKSAKFSGKVILGGDVFFKTNDKIESKGEGWFYNEDGNFDSEKSYLKATDYIEKFMKNNSECIFEIVIM